MIRKCPNCHTEFETEAEYPLLYSASNERKYIQTN